jgi:hypothetical protein
VGTADIERVRASLSELVALDPEVLGHGETVLEVEALLAQAEALAARTVAAFDASGEWASDGAKSSATWVAGTCRLPRGVVKRQLKLGRAARHLPVFEAAWGEGQVSGAHVDLVESVRRFETEDLLERDEELLAQSAQSLTFNHFNRAVKYWEHKADPDGAEKSAEHQVAERDVWLVSSLDGMYVGKMFLDPISGAIVSGELERLENQLFEADWAEATERLGREPALAELRRTPSQRRADALVEMATRSASCPADATRPRPLFTVLVNYELLHGRILELAQGSVLTPGSVLRYLDHCDIERAVFTPGARVEVSERSRLFSGATRRALEIRDRECTHPLCEEQVQRCQADHIEPFSHGGLTVQENGRILCGFHNRLRNTKAEREREHHEREHHEREREHPGKHPPPNV